MKPESASGSAENIAFDIPDRTHQANTLQIEISYSSRFPSVKGQ